MNEKKVKKILAEIKIKFEELEREMQGEEKNDKDYIRTRYKITNQKEIIGGEKGLTKIAVFETLISLEANNRTLEQLNSIFDKSLFPSLGGFATYDYIAKETDIKKYDKDLQRKYSKKIFKTKDKKSVRIFNQWASFENIEKETPGNFPVLVEIAKKLGYDILAVN